MLASQISTQFLSSRSQQENSNITSLNIAKKSDTINAELQKYRMLKSKGITNTENAQNQSSDLILSLNTNPVPSKITMKKENIALSELLSPRIFYIKRLSLPYLETYQNLLLLKEERVSKFSIDSDLKTANSSNINNSDSEKKQYIPSFTTTTNSNASPNTNRNITNYSNIALNLSSSTNINTNDKTKSLDLLKNNEIADIKAAISANKKDQEKAIQSLKTKGIFIL